jgi:hypothetical protein
MKDEEFWEEDAILKDLLFTTNMSIAEISREMDWTQAKTSKRIKQLGLSWVRRDNRKLSRGHAALTTIMKRLLPGEEVVNEYHIGERLMLDVYCAKYKVAAEYHGRQHFFFSNLFHKDMADFREGQERDERKVELCREQGIALVVFRFNDKLTDEAVYDRMIEAIRDTPYVKKEKKTIKGNAYYEAMKQRKREQNRINYQRMKQRKNLK